VGGGWACRPLPLASPAILGRLRHLHILALPTHSYKSTQTQHAACVNAGMNRYPNFYGISRFDIRMNEKFDLNITNTVK